jgi:hypothetical protein
VATPQEEEIKDLNKAYISESLLEKILDQWSYNFSK